MRITNHLRRVTEGTGDPVEVIQLANSRFDEVQIKHQMNEDALQIRARDTIREEPVAYSFDIINAQYTGAYSDSALRRDVDADILDALLSVGYTVVDEQVR